MKNILILFSLSVFYMFTGCGETKKIETPSAQTKANNTGSENEGSGSSGGNPVASHDGFYYVALDGKRPALYYRKFSETSAEIVWSKNDESVIEVVYSQDKNSVFFLSTSAYGKDGVLPYFRKLKVYRFDYNTPEKVRMCSEAGDCVNYKLFTSVGNLLQLETNTFTSPEHIMVKNKVHIFDKDGTTVEQKTKTVDITKDGFPQLTKPKLQNVSDDGKYAILLSKDNFIILKEINKSGYKDIKQTAKTISQVGFTPDNSAAVVSTVDITPGNETLYEKEPDTAELLLYLIKEKKVQFQIKGSGYKRFMIFGHILVYENGFGEKSEIIIYSIKDSKEVSRIKVKGGCGLLNIPQIPDYAA